MAPGAGWADRAYPSCLPLFSPAAYHYFLPSYLVYALDHFTHDAMPTEFLVYDLAVRDHDDEELVDHAGVGALISALSLTVRKSVLGLTRMLQIASATLGAALTLFGLSRALWLSLVFMVLVGFGMMQAAAVSNTVIQSLVPEDKRARVMSYYTMAFFGASPFGSLFAGALAHRIGAPATVMLTGACCIAGAVWFTLDLPKVRAIMRPIYQQNGPSPQPRIIRG